MNHKAVLAAVVIGFLAGIVLTFAMAPLWAWPRASGYGKDSMMRGGWYGPGMMGAWGGASAEEIREWCNRSVGAGAQ